MTTKLLIGCTFAALCIGGVAQAETGSASQEGAAFEAGDLETGMEPSGSVARSSFTTEVLDREPVDAVEELTSDSDQVSYFTELTGMTGQTVTHRWEWNGQVMAEVPFQVGGPRWRTHSSKKLEPSWLGEWTVSVVGSDGQVLQSDTLTYAAPAQVLRGSVPTETEMIETAEETEPANDSPPAAID